MRIEESQGSNGGQNGHAQPAKSAPTAEQILGEIRDYCRQTQTAESTFGRLVVNDGKLVSRLRDGARITTGTLDKVRAYLAEHRPASTAAAGQPSPVAKPLNGAAAANAVAPPGFRFFDNRQKYLLFVSTCSEKTEVGQPHLARTRQSAAGAAGAAHLRCRRRRRHRAVAGDAGGACALPHHAALRRGEGDQLRRRPPDAGEDGGPPVRASRHRAGRDQSLLRRGAVADAAFGDVGARPDLEGRHADRQHRARLRRADRRARRLPRRELARRASARPRAIRSISVRSS